MHMGQVKAGLRASGRRLAQCTSVVIRYDNSMVNHCTFVLICFHMHRTRKRFPMQIDGEPWIQPPCTVSTVRQRHLPYQLEMEKNANISTIIQQINYLVYYFI